MSTYVGTEQSPNGPTVASFRHPKSDTNTCVVWDAKTKIGAIVDSCTDYDMIPHNKIHYTHCNEVIAFVEAQGLTIQYLLETHVHADHISGAPYMKTRFPEAKVAIGSCISEVQRTFSSLLNLDSVSGDGREFDILFEDNATFELGNLTGRVLHTPGHTPACVSYVIGDAAFTGDTIFHEAIGTGRCDFPGGSATTMYHSCQRILALPDATRVYWGHDYPGSSRSFTMSTTVATIKSSNKHLKANATEAAYVEARTTRDAQLNPPGLLYPSLQTNVRAGVLPDPESNGTRFIKLPLFVPMG